MTEGTAAVAYFSTGVLIATAAAAVRTYRGNTVTSEEGLIVVFGAIVFWPIHLVVAFIVGGGRALSSLATKILRPRG